MPDVYCPRCDRAYKTMEILTEHVKKAHPEMYDNFAEDDD